MRLSLIWEQPSQSSAKLPGVAEQASWKAAGRDGKGIWVKFGPGNNAQIEISQIWVKYGPENSENKTNHNLPTVFMLWQYVGIGFETNLSNHGRQRLADPENIIFMFQIFRTWIDHALSPWPPVEPLTAR